MKTMLLSLALVTLGWNAALADAPLEEVPTPAQDIKRAPPYLANDTVEVWGNWWGTDRWNVSVILEVKDGKYRIWYGGGRYNVVWVTDEKIRNEVREKQEQARRDLVNAFWQEARRFDGAVYQFVHWVMHPNEPVTWTVAGPEQVKTILAELTELDGICTARYASIEDTEQTWKDDYKRLPATWCKVAAQRQDIAAKVLAIGASQRVKELRKWLAQLGKSYEVGDVHVAAGSWYAVLYPKGHDKVKGIIRSDELDDILDRGGAQTLGKIQGELAQHFTPFGVPEDAATLAFYHEVKQALAALKRQVETTLPAPVFVARGKDKAMQNAARAEITGKILKSAVLSPKWVVTVDQYRNPLDRVKIGSIVYQAGARCVYVSYAFKQYPAGRRWSAGEITQWSEFYQRCK